MKNEENKQIKAARRMLAELADMAEHGSLTGSLSSGTEQAAKAYNRTLGSLTERGLVPEGMFEPLDVGHADFGQIGVQCRLLLATIAEEDSDESNDAVFGEVVALAPFLDSQALGQLVRERVEGASRLPDGLLAALAPFLDSETLGSLVQRKLRPAAPPNPPAPPPTPPTPVAPAPPREQAEDLRPVIADPPPAQLETIAAELRRPDLTVEERQQIAVRLAELAYDQSTHVQG